MGIHAHRDKGIKSVTFAIITVSSSRSIAEDESGNWIASAVTRFNHDVVSRVLVNDEATKIEEKVRSVISSYSPSVLILTGGTGITSTDVTIEALRPMFSKELTAFSALFTQLSYAQIGTGALLSRACAGLIKTTVTFCLPGSLAACQLAMEDLILPEIGHLVSHAQQ
ncbi:MAG: MogA/MoaB family molybdenum cofactor biosynthesis protein [Pseudomonadota bacterium]